ncbi:MAG TPA: hypothetical protein VN131_06140, partial [Mobilitalea sp.]|nr:hypothetical protein [Mobilitalea sp.]
MLIVTEGKGLFIKMPVGIQVLTISFVLVCIILLILYNRFRHLKNKLQFPIDSKKTEEMLGPKEWEKRMLDLAADHKNVKVTRYNSILDDYNQIVYKKLNRIRNKITELSTDVISLIPAARWLYDNFQMMYREIKKVRASGTSYEILPTLKTKEYKGFPRIYIVAKEMVALSAGHLNEENISIMLKAYQKEIPLNDKEIWVLPEMLGFCLLESIIRVSEEILHIIALKSKADKFVKEKLGNGQTVLDISALLVDTDVDCKDNFSFHSHVIYLLKNMSFNDAAIQKYLDYHCISKDKQLKPSNLFTEEGRIESNLETNIRTLIVSLREINEIDEERFFESFSYLEQILSADPDGVYSKMDSESRGMYRGVIVKLSLKFRINEEKIADECLELAKSGREDLNCSHHVGTYLLGKGYPLLKAKVRNKPVPANIKSKTNVKGICYFILLFIILIALGGFIAWLMNRLGNVTNIFIYIVVLIISLPMLFGIAGEITNFIFTRRIRVKKLPSLDYLREIPDNARTFIAMPVIVSSKEQGLEYLERLHKHYLANHQPNLHFGLLIDFEDSPQQVMQKDEIIENALVNRLNELNEQYPSEHQRFSLFIRYRRWNPSENCYMGWERKRGKLEEFNNLLIGTSKEATSFSTVLCDHEILGSFQYVITLDADSNLIRDNAAKLVGLIDHPLNKPVLDAEGRKVKDGYVIIQPSVRNHIVDKKGSRFVDIFGGQSGLAHYSTVISDIYQDIFNQGIYIGKGIYEIQAFHLLLQGTVPENRVLSHDLLESCLARTAFSSSAKIM